MDESQHPDRENFGEASLGEAQSSDPPSDPEMIRDEADEDAQDREEFKRDIENDPARAPEGDDLERYRGG